MLLSLLIDVIFAGIMDMMPEITDLLGLFADTIKVVLPVAIGVLMPIIEELVRELMGIAKVAISVTKEIVSFASMLKDVLIKRFTELAEWVGKVVEKIGKFFGVTNDASKGADKLAKSTGKAGEAMESMSKQAQKIWA